MGACGFQNLEAEKSGDVEEKSIFQT